MDPNEDQKIESKEELRRKLENMTEEELEKLKAETKDEALLNEIVYTLRMVPKLKYLLS